MNSRRVHGMLLKVLLTLTLTCAPLDAFPEPQDLTPSNRSAALAALEDVAPERRAEAVAWFAVHGGMADQPLLFRRLRDGNELVRGFAEQGLWRLWARSGDAAVDRLLAEGIERMHFGALAGYGQIYFRLEQHAKAIEYWRRALAVNPNMHGLESNIEAAEELLKERRGKTI